MLREKTELVPRLTILSSDSMKGHIPANTETELLLFFLFIYLIFFFTFLHNLLCFYKQYLATEAMQNSNSVT